jgi:hypothetical protein
VIGVGIGLLLLPVLRPWRARRRPDGGDRLAA